ncbi:MAG: hypothetical protein WD942_10040 [Dehalococcoidia bacterium]
MSTVAYGRRSALVIRVRRFLHGVLVMWRRANRWLFRVRADRHLAEVLVFAHAKTDDELGDVVNRLIWGFPPDSGVTLRVVVGPALSGVSIESLPSPKGQVRYIASVPHLTLEGRWRIWDLFRADLILTMKFPRPVVAFLPFVVGKLEIADPWYYAWTEGNVWKNTYYFTFSEEGRESYDELSRRNFSRLYEESRDRSESYCFLTGPSFDEYERFSYGEDSLKVVCNSIIKNDQFLEHIGGPHVLTFADPVFHFGPSVYAETFREKAVEVVEKYRCYLVVPQFTVPLMVARHPSLRDFIIGIAVKSSGPFNFPTAADLTTLGTTSISTYLMLPVASSLTGRVHFIGADGRKPDENYFWKHNPQVQYADLMETVFETHPSFFRDRVYADYYDEYCDVFESIVAFGERQGKEYLSLTDSHIPALSRRVLGH